MSGSLVSVSTFLLCSVCIHVAVNWVTSRDRFLLKGLAIGVIGSLAIAVYRSLSTSSWILETYIYFSAWVFYMMAFMNLLNSVTLKMLSLLYVAPRFTLDKQSLESVLSDSNGFDSRFALMEQNGLIETAQDTLALTRNGQLLASIIGITRTLMATDVRPDSPKD